MYKLFVFFFIFFFRKEIGIFLFVLICSFLLFVPSSGFIYKTRGKKEKHKEMLRDNQKEETKQQINLCMEM